MRFISRQKAALAAAAALTLLAAGGASVAGQGARSAGAGAVHGGGVSGGAVVVLPGAERAHGVHQGRWMGGDGFGGPGQHWESPAHDFRHGGFQREFRLGHAHRRGWRSPGYFGGGAYSDGYYGGPGSVDGGYYGGNGVYYTDNVLAYSDDSYRPAAYSAIDVYPPVDADYYDQVYIAAPTIIEIGAPSSCAPAPAYKPLQHIYYAPTTQFRPTRKKRGCFSDQY